MNDGKSFLDALATEAIADDRAALVDEAARGLRYAEQWGESLVSILTWYVRTGRPLLQSPLLRECVEEYLWSKTQANRQLCTLEGYRSRLLRFAERYGDWLPVSITSDEVVGFLRDRWQPTTRLGWMVCLSTFFEWCVKKRYALANPLAEVGRPRGLGHRGDIFTPDEAREILREAGASRQLGFWVMSLFSGLRTVEIMRLGAHPAPWDLVRLSDDVIVVPENQSKTTRRTFQISPQLRAWLEVMRDRRVPFYPTGARTAEIGRVRRTVLQRLRGENRLSPEYNMGRRSFISYSLARSGASYSDVAAMAGNSEKMIRKYYRRAVSATSARAYFEILPE